MKTKDTILSELQKQNPYSIPIYKAMDEWAKQQSIEFVEWKDKYFKTTYPIDRKMYTLKYYSHVEETGSTFGTHYNILELYEIFNKIQHNKLNINY